MFCDAAGKGYQRSGNACVVVHLPAHATLDYYGHAWECQRGYTRVRDACEKMTALPETAMYGSSAVQEPRVIPQQQNDANGPVEYARAMLHFDCVSPG